MRRAVPAFIAALVLSVLVVAGVEGWQMYKSSQSAKGAQAYQDAIDTGAKGDVEKAFQQFDDLAKHGGPYQALALMQQAGIRMDQNRPADAAPLATLEAKLSPLADASRPYHIQAREALALARLANGKAAQAKQDFVAISSQIDTPDTARQRAQAIIALIDSGTGANLKQLADAAKTATPIPLPSEGPPPGAQGAPDQAQPEAAQ